MYVCIYCRIVHLLVLLESLVHVRVSFLHKLNRQSNNTARSVNSVCVVIGAGEQISL